MCKQVIKGFEIRVVTGWCSVGTNHRQWDLAFGPASCYFCDPGRVIVTFQGFEFLSVKWEL